MRKVPERVDTMLEVDAALEEDLILYYYGEARRPAEIRRRLENDSELAERYAELCRSLDAASSLPVPEVDANFNERVWSRLQPELEREQGLEPEKNQGFGFFRERLQAWLAPRPALAMMALLLIAAFMAGRWSRPALSTGLDDPALATVSDSATMSDEGRERLVLVAVSQHLERSERLLRDLANAPAEGGLTYERQSADALIGANRLYRQASSTAGRADLAALLDELERLLLEIARGPEELAPADMEYIRDRVDETLFKVEIVGTRLRQQDSPSNTKPLTTPQERGDSV